MHADDAKLGRAARAAILDPANTLYVSAASAWEIAIKAALGRLRLGESPETYVPSRMQLGGLTPLPVEHAHALRVHRLPMHHTDPFDRLLIVQAQHERLRILTPDDAYAPYDVDLLW
jgi:PIN domain nuclease of toxin-antitoxin system